MILATFAIVVGAGLLGWGLELLTHDAVASYVAAAAGAVAGVFGASVRYILRPSSEEVPEFRRSVMRAAGRVVLAAGAATLVFVIYLLGRNNA